MGASRTLSRRELTAALAARQMLLARERLDPAEAIRRLTPLQGQHPPAPYLSLAARLDGFDRPALERAVSRGTVVKATLNRHTLHLASAGEYRAYAQLVRQGRLRTWRNRYPHLDEVAVTRTLRRWFAPSPRTNEEIRERVGRYEGVADNPWEPISFARTLLPLVQLPPAGFWDDPRRSRFVVYPGALPKPAAAAAIVLCGYLAAFGPASRRDVAAWAGVAQRDFAEAFKLVGSVSYRSEEGTELLDLPGAPLPPPSTRVPVRLLAHWDQPLLAYADRERIIAPEAAPHNVTLTGVPTVAVDGRVAGSWECARDGGHVLVTVTPFLELSRASRREIAEEAARTGRFCEPDARSVEVAGV
jgi:hypothetical protein